MNRYQCRTCWGDGPVRYGCCEACYNECHAGHDLVLQSDNLKRFCDCGHNLHRIVCTANISYEPLHQVTRLNLKSLAMQLSFSCLI